jgi:tRNA(fMet)-specific endonuclease VapC
MLVVDTDLLTIIQRKSGNEYACLNARLEQASAQQTVCVTIISLAEQMRGWLAFIARARFADQQIEGYRRLHAFVDDFRARPILDFDAVAAERFQDLRRAKIRIGTMDLRIAAIALANNAKLLSRNLADFRRVPGLSVEDWATGTE